MISLSAAKIEVARVAGAQGDQNKLALAGSAIKATAKRWSNKNNWEWCRRDNSTTTILVGDTTSSSAVVAMVTSTTAGLNPGQSVSGSGIQASTTILTVDRVDQITLSKTATATAQGINLTFGGYIPVIAGTQSYFLPGDFSDFYSARLLTSFRTLEIIRDRQVDREEPVQNIQGPAVGITLAPIGSDAGFTAADQRPRCKLVPYLPDTSENLFLRYYRTINGTADPIDIPEDFEWAFIDDAKTWFIANLNSNDPRLAVIGALARRDLDEVINKDRDIEDEDVRMKSQMEIFQTAYTERGRALRPF